jgi:uncharacterized protein (TIGR00369 family)
MKTAKMIPDGLLPWTRSCFVCGENNPKGLHLKAHHRKGRIHLDYLTKPEDFGYQNIVHGGIGAMLLDEAMTWASLLSFGKISVAAEFTLRLLAPIGAGEKVHAEAWVINPGKRLCLCTGEMKAGEKRVMTCTGKYVPMPSDKISSLYEDFVISEKTIPPHVILDDFPAENKF